MSLVRKLERFTYFKEFYFKTHTIESRENIVKIIFYQK